MCLFCFCCFQHTFVESKTMKTYSEVKSVVFSSSKFQRCSQLGNPPSESRMSRCQEIIYHGTSTNQLEKLFHTHFWVILVTINDVPPIQATYRVFEPLTTVRKIVGILTVKICIVDTHFRMLGFVSYSVSVSFW